MKRLSFNHRSIATLSVLAFTWLLCGPAAAQFQFRLHPDVVPIKPANGANGYSRDVREFDYRSPATSHANQTSQPNQGWKRVSSAQYAYTSPTTSSKRNANSDRYASADRSATANRYSYDRVNGGDSYRDPNRSYIQSQRPRTTVNRLDSSLSERFSPEELVNINVYERSNRSVVNITTRISRAGSTRRDEASRGSGSGFVVDQQGHVLTNFHVIRDADTAVVTLSDGESYLAELVGSDPANDIAVLRVDAPLETLFPIDIGESDGLRVGQKVFAIGNPFGLDRSFTVGILSSKNRTLPSQTGSTMNSILQVDAALNRGNSGGPLLNSRGQLIGMNTAIASPSGRGENTGVGFAIPVSTLRRIVPELMTNGRIARADSGISHVYETNRGLVVAELKPGGPAESAGMRPVNMQRGQTTCPHAIGGSQRDRDNADLIVAVDGKTTLTADKFVQQIESRRPGDKVVVTVLRGNQSYDVPIVLTNKR